jgi:hypothetical protein
MSSLSFGVAGVLTAISAQVGPEGLLSCRHLTPLRALATQQLSAPLPGVR